MSSWTSADRKKIGEQSLLEIANSPQAHLLEELKLDWVRNISENGLIKISESCTRLQVLSLRKIDGITALAPFIQNMSNLTFLDIWRIASHLTFRVNCYGFFPHPFSDIKNIGQCCSKLQHLGFCDCAADTEAFFQLFRGCLKVRLPARFHHLCQVGVSGSLALEVGKHTRAFVIVCKNIKSFKFEVSYLPKTGFAAIADTFGSQLTYFSTAMSGATGDLSYLLQGCPHLQELNLNHAGLQRGKRLHPLIALHWRSSPYVDGATLETPIRCNESGNRLSTSSWSIQNFVWISKS